MIKKQQIIPITFKVQPTITKEQLVVGFGLSEILRLHLIKCKSCMTGEPHELCAEATALYNSLWN